MRRKIIITLCMIGMLGLAGCTNDVPQNLTANAETDSNVSGNTFGVFALIEIGDGLWYDKTTRIVYWWNGMLLQYSRATTPTAYYAPNGLPYRYNPETNEFEEISSVDE